MRYWSELAGGLTACITEPGALTAEARSTWDGLCRSQPHLASPFFSLAYTEAVAACRSGVRVCVISRGGRPVAFLPFQFATPLDRLLRNAERVGGELTDHFGLVAPRGFSIDPQTLLRLSALNQFEFNHLDETQLELGLDGERRELGLAIDFANGSQRYWAERRNLDKKFHSNTMRVERRLTEEVGAIRLVFDSPARERELAHLIEFKQAQYRRTGAMDALAEPWMRRVLHRLATVADPQCTAVLSVLTAGDHWVASHFGLRHGRLLHYWFPVYNPEMRKYAPGRLLLKQLIDSTAATGISLIDRGAGDGAAKQELANRELHYYRGLWVRSNGYGSLCRLRASLRWRLYGWRERRAAAARVGAAPS